MTIKCEAVNVDECVVAEARGAHLRCENVCAYADDNPVCLRAENARLARGCNAALAYLADPPSAFPENRAAAVEIISAALAGKGEE